LDDSVLDRLVATRALTDAQAKAVGFSASLYSLVDQDSNLATAIRSAKFAPLGGNAPASTEELAKLSRDDWSKFFSANAALVPADSTAAEAAEAMSGRLSGLHPVIALASRLPQIVPDVATAQLTALSKLAGRNPQVIGVDTSALDMT